MGFTQSAQERRNTDLAASPSHVATANRDYLQQMAKSDKWGDGVMLEAAARHYRQRILVVVYKEEKRYEVFNTRHLSLIHI